MGFIRLLIGALPHNTERQRSIDDDCFFYPFRVRDYFNPWRIFCVFNGSSHHMLKGRCLMRKRITNAQLAGMIDTLNRLTGNPSDPMKVGSFALDFSNGGVMLERVTNESGGVVSLSVRMTKREMAQSLGTSIAVLSEKWRG